MGEIRDSGRVLTTHPQFWNEPGGEYPRLTGNAVTHAQIIARNAAREHGLKTADEPLIVTRASSVAQAVTDQYWAFGRALRIPVAAWAFCLALAIAWRARRAASS